MNTNKTIYKLLEVIELPENTNIHMVNGKDYKINKEGEIVSQHGDKLPISKSNIKNCEFTIIEQKKNYNFRVYKDDKLIQSFNQSNLTKNEVGLILEELYYKNGGVIVRYESCMNPFHMNTVQVVSEVIVDKKMIKYGFQKDINKLRR